MDPFEHLDRELVDRADVLDAGVVDEHVDIARERVDGIRRGEVAHEGSTRRASTPSVLRAAQSVSRALASRSTA